MGLSIPACPAPVVAFLNDTLQTIESHVGQDRRDNSTLRRSFIGIEERGLLDISGFKPLTENSLLHRDMPYQPVVVDVVETALDVPFENPPRSVLAAQENKTMFYCVGRISASAKAVGGVVRRGFGDGFQRQQE